MNTKAEEKRDRIDKGTIQALLLRFNTQRMPRAVAMKEKVDAGELLNDSDLHLIKQVQSDWNQIRGLFGRHPEYNELVAGATELWTHIRDTDVENRKAKKY